jgi:hypothetical protein
MKRCFLTLLTLILMSASTPASARDAGEYLTDAGLKLGFGIGDVLYSPFEVIVHTGVYTIDFDEERSRDTGGTVVGLLVGGARGLTRLSRGVIDIGTFFWPADRQSERTWEWALGGIDDPITDADELRPEGSYWP